MLTIFGCNLLTSRLKSGVQKSSSGTNYAYQCLDLMDMYMLATTENRIITYLTCFISRKKTQFSLLIGPYALSKGVPLYGTAALEAQTRPSSHALAYWLLYLVLDAAISSYSLLSVRLELCEF